MSSMQQPRSTVVVAHPQIHVILGGIHLAVGILSFLIEVGSIIFLGPFLGFYTAYILAAIVYIITGSMAVTSAKRQNRCLFISTLVFTIISSVFAVLVGLLLYADLRNLHPMFILRLLICLGEFGLALTHSIFCYVFCCCRTTPISAPPVASQGQSGVGYTAVPSDRNVYNNLPPGSYPVQQLTRGPNAGGLVQQPYYTPAAPQMSPIYPPLLANTAVGGDVELKA